MRAFAHIVGAAALVALAIWLVLRATRVIVPGSGKLPDRIIKVVAFGATRERWLWQLRAANLALAAVSLVAAVAVLAST